VTKLLQQSGEKQKRKKREGSIAGVAAD
jgi:hypothetical protein